jgi:hypothetical protein
MEGKKQWTKNEFVNADMRYISDTFGKHGPGNHATRQLE